MKLPTLNNDYQIREKKGFRRIPIIPTEEEMLAPPPKDLPINIIDEPYDSHEEYLETHYKLLREDCISPLREGIRLLQTQPEELNSNLRIYEKINLVGISLASMGIVHRISFMIKHSERVHWATNKRLLPGTLVVFSKDNFKTMKFGTVVNRPLELLKKVYDLQVDVHFRLDAEFEWSEGYVMVEATSSYFEAYRHILKVLQELDPEKLPFKEHIIGLDQKIDVPKYLQTQRPDYKFENDIRCDIMEEWPTVEKISPGLHSSQYDALKRMLTCRLALIQGPPGTGKTYMGLKAVKILLENLENLKGPTIGPIVIACQTNHALDQFLEGIQEFEENIIRLGSRSRSNKIKPYTLYNIVQDLKLSDPSSLRNRDIGPLFKKRDDIKSKIIKLCKEIRNPFVKYDFIKKQCLTNDQLSSLKRDDWFGGEDTNSKKNYIREWLEDSIATTTSKQNDMDFQVTQLISQDSGNQMEDEDEITEEEIQDVEADYADYHETDDILKNADFEKLRSEECIRLNTSIRDDQINEYESEEDLWEIPLEIRAAMHNRWRRKRLKEVYIELKNLCEQYSKISDKIKTERIRENLSIVKSARVIGMTTTAAAKNHELLVNLKPKIMIIEEAAETLEAHIVAALTPATEHLILIGDHQQLRPSVSVHELESHKLNVSLFERLVKFLPFCQLTEQRRMRPEIRRLLTPIYKDELTDHEDVNKYPDVPGFYDNLFFFDHIEEEAYEPDSTSKINDFEARMCAKFANYLVKGRVSAKRITILSMYSGQRKLICKYLKEDFRKTPELNQIRVSSVDGFQGEQNDIILLSLVRSREQPRSSIGFLGISNRVCVALSRAKHGLYIFGNASQLKNRSDLWKSVLDILEKAGLCGQTINLCCQKHSNKEGGPASMEITVVADYNCIPPEGGCSRWCGEVMGCGHVCPSKCHMYPHNETTCQSFCMQ
ncbi:P-loop containing nucleoside triphosphate hydrolase protein [Glomus cerebriforme]|uniref:P-loop containing nucleoside triphosphate hydrolase protein n=1 Tax=Glomus cerebriforme TaxID=658196 RepID=A0A397SMD0_9GLOM|nr:P-loop containing nucleoside triphosphate hydrolase protein [Glomus cerebriforme]